MGQESSLQAIKDTEEGEIIIKAFKQVKDFQTLVCEPKRFNELKDLFLNLEELRKRKIRLTEVDNSNILWCRQFKCLEEKLQAETKDRLLLHTAILHGNHKALELLLKKHSEKGKFKVKVNRRNPYGNTALSSAAQYNKLDCICILCDLACDELNLHTPGQHGSTPVQWLMEWADTKRLKLEENKSAWWKMSNAKEKQTQDEVLKAQLGKLVIDMCEVYKAVNQNEDQASVVKKLHSISEDLAKVQNHGFAEECNYGSAEPENYPPLRHMYQMVCRTVNNLKMKALNKIFYGNGYHFDISLLCDLVSTGFSRKHHGWLIRKARGEGMGSEKEKGWLPCPAIHNKTEGREVITLWQCQCAAALMICHAAAPGIYTEQLLKDLLQVPGDNGDRQRRTEARHAIHAQPGALAQSQTTSPSQNEVELFKCTDCCDAYQKIVGQLPEDLKKKAIRAAFQNAQLSALSGKGNNIWPTQLLWCLVEPTSGWALGEQNVTRVICWNNLRLRTTERFMEFNDALEKSIPTALRNQRFQADLSKNPRIKKVPSVLLNMKQLLSLNLSHSKALDLASTSLIFIKLSCLEILDLSDCGLTHLVDANEEMPCYLPLKELYLADNKLSSLPEALQNYPLGKLDLRRNKLSNVPKWISKLDLTVLHLDGNGKIDKLPPELGRILKVGVTFSVKEGCKPLSILLNEDGIGENLTTAEIGKHLRQKLTCDHKVAKLVVLGHRSTLHDEFCDLLSASAHLKLPYDNILHVGDLAMYSHFGSLLDDGNSHYLLVWDGADHSSKYKMEEYLKLVRKHSPQQSENCPYKKRGHVAVVDLHNGPDSIVEQAIGEEGVRKITLDAAWCEQRKGLQSAWGQVSDWAKKCTCKIETQALYAEFSEHIRSKLKETPVLTIKHLMEAKREFSSKHSRLLETDGTASDQNSSAWNIVELKKDLRCRGTAIQLGVDTDFIMSTSWLLQELAKSAIYRTRQDTPRGEDHFIPAVVAEETQSSIEHPGDPNLLALRAAASQIGLVYPLHASSDVTERFCPFAQEADEPAGFWDTMKKHNVIHRACVFSSKDLHDLPNLIAFYHRFQAHVLADLTNMLHLPATEAVGTQSTDAVPCGLPPGLAERIGAHRFQVHTWQRGFSITHEEEFFCSSLLIDTDTASNVRAHNCWPAHGDSNRKAGLLLSVRRDSTQDKAAISSLSGMVDVAVQLVLDTDKSSRSYVEQYVICSQCVTQDNNYPGSINAVAMFDSAHHQHFKSCRHRPVDSANPLQAYLPDFLLKDLDQHAGAVRLISSSDFSEEIQRNPPLSGKCSLQVSGQMHQCYRKVYEKNQYGEYGKTLRANVIAALRQELAIYRILQEIGNVPGSAFLVKCLGAYSASSDQLGLALEYLGEMTLEKLLEDRAHCVPWSCLLRNRMAAELSCGLSYLHRCGIIHRDLKANNIMLPQGTESNFFHDKALLKIIDVDASFRVSASYPKHCEDVMQGDHRAPEIHSLREYPGQYGPQADVFSLGRIFASLITMKAIKPGREGNATEVVLLAKQQPGGLEPLANAMADSVEKNMPSQRPSALQLASCLTSHGAHLLMKSFTNFTQMKSRPSLAVVRAVSNAFLWVSIPKQYSDASEADDTDNLLKYDCSGKLQGTLKVVSRDFTAPDKNCEREVLCLTAGPPGTLLVAMRFTPKSQHSARETQKVKKIVVRLYKVSEATGDLKTDKQDETDLDDEVTTMCMSGQTLLIGTANRKLWKLETINNEGLESAKKSPFELDPLLCFDQCVVQLVPFSYNCVWWLVHGKAAIANSYADDKAVVGVISLLSKEVSTLRTTARDKIIQLAKVTNMDSGMETLWACSQHHLFFLHTETSAVNRSNKYECTEYSLKSCLPEDIYDSEMVITDMCSARNTLWIATRKGRILVVKPSRTPLLIGQIEGHQYECSYLWPVTTTIWEEDEERVISFGGPLELFKSTSKPNNSKADFAMWRVPKQLSRCFERVDTLSKEAA